MSCVDGSGLFSLARAKSVQGLSKNDPDGVSSFQEEMRLCMCTDLILYLSGGAAVGARKQKPGLICFTLAHYNHCPDGLFDTVWLKSRLLSCCLTRLCSGFQWTMSLCSYSPGGSRGWQTSSTASSTFLVADQSSPWCHHWIGPLLKHVEIQDITSKTQLNTAFANLVRCTYSNAYYIHSRFGVQSLTLLLRVFSLWEYQVLKILSRHWMLLWTVPIKFKWRVGCKETHETTGWPFQ